MTREGDAGGSAGERWSVLVGVGGTFAACVVAGVMIGWPLTEPGMRADPERLRAVIEGIAAPRLAANPAPYASSAAREFGEEVEWVDRDAGLVRVPPDLAIELMLERGFELRGDDRR